MNFEDIGIPRIEIVIVIVVGVVISLMIELNPIRNAVLLRTLNFGANSMFSLESRSLHKAKSGSFTLLYHIGVSLMYEDSIELKSV